MLKKLNQLQKINKLNKGASSSLLPLQFNKAIRKIKEFKAENELLKKINSKNIIIEIQDLIDELDFICEQKAYKELKEKINDINRR